MFKLQNYKGIFNMKKACETIAALLTVTVVKVVVHF